VYVTDTADADEVIEEPEDEEAILQHQQGQLQAQVQQGVQETAREAAAAAQVGVCVAYA
jgi:hypothetical protein